MIQGRVLGIKIDGDFYPCEMSGVLEYQEEMLPTASKEKGYWNDYIGGQRGWTITLDGRLNALESVRSSFNNIISKVLKTRDQFQVEFASKTETPTIRYFGNARISSFSLGANSTEKATGNFVFQGCGVLNEEIIDIDYLINSMPIVEDKPFIVKM